MKTTKLLLILAVSAFSTSIFAQNKEISLNDIWRSGTFFPEYVYGINSMNDGAHYTSLGASSIEKYSYKTGEKVETIYSTTEIRFSAYQFSADERKILLPTETEQIYRHSTRSKYYVYDRDTEKLEVLSEGKQRYATFSPSGSKVAFVRDNNLFVKDFETGAETQVTTDGEKNKIINGATDWVYEEEYAFDKAFFWAPDGNSIAYYRFDEERVPEFSMDIFGKGLYPEQERFKYPKCGEDNAIVTVHIYNTNSKKTVNTNLSGYEYIPRVKWTNDANEVCVFTMNRHQNKLELNIVNATTGESKVIYTESDPAYIDITDNLTFLKDNSFIWTSEVDGYNHIYYFDKNGKQITQVTKGQWDVTNFYGLDEKSNTLYYQSAEESPIQRAVYSIRLNGKRKKKLSEKTGTNAANFSNGFKYYINTHSDANTPPFFSLHEANGKQIRVIKDNEGLKTRMEGYDLSPKEFFKFTTSEGVELNGWMIKPANFDESKQYPVFMFVYGGPGSQTVEDQWGGVNYFWYQMLAQKGYIVASVDNRGTGARGRDFKKITYKELGKYETVDQIEAAKHFASLPYVDGDRIGIQGWSYGGYMSSLCITKGADMFKMAIAVAPVTNWKYYDSIYTERYMQTPQENNDGYENNSPINHVKKLNAPYLLVHGSADDNVHYQNTMEMIEALVQADKQFDLFIYPNKNHGIYGGNTRYHLYTKMTNFILENL